MSNFSWRPPSVPFEAQTRDGSPFTVWHVCIICQQPRSARYHSEHPVDANFAVSPPQSVCRRCASKSSSLPLPVPIPAPQIPTPQIPTPPVPAPSSPPPQPESRNIPFRYVKPFIPEPQHVEPPPEPASTVEPTITSFPTIEIMPPRAPSYEEYLVVKRENARRWSDAPHRDYYPAPIRDHPPPSRDYPAPIRDLYATSQDYSATAREYPEPPLENPARFRDYPPPARDRPTPIRDYPIPSRERSAPLANVKPIKRRVSFSAEDEVATLPPDLPSERDDRSMQGLSRMRLQPPNLSGMPSVQDDYEYEKQRDRTYIDPTERPYVPEPKWTPLSESPARELPLVEESYAHGPYRAENSPTPSMEVHVDNHDFVLDKKYAMRKAPRQYGTQPVKDENRAWTRYVTVKEYRDEKGPFVEVEEKFVFDDEC